MTLRPVMRAAAILCLLAQGLVAIAPAGVEVCMRAIADRFTDLTAGGERGAAATVAESCCDCCGEDEPPAPGADIGKEQCPPGCDCCMSVPQTDQLPGSGGGWSAASLTQSHLLPMMPAEDCIAFFADVRLVGDAACERPPPERTAWCRSIRLLI